MTPRRGTAGIILSNRYTLTERIAAGGMGEVWGATDNLLRRAVAVKLLHPALSSEPDFVERFRAEARHTAALQHPNIATVFDYGEDDGTAYLVMELVAGQPLSQLIAVRAPLSAHEAASILGQAAMALEAAHRGGVVHRDVKPANILITPDGTAKLTDFGISRLVDSAPLTQTGQILGTAQYLSPEQALGQRATASSDIYALGVVGHEMLTGQRPFDAGSIVATALAHINKPAPQLPDAVPSTLRNVIGAALAKDPADRPASAAAMAEALGMPVTSLAAGSHALPAGSPAFAAGSSALPAGVRAASTLARPLAQEVHRPATTQAMSTVTGAAMPAPTLATQRVTTDAAATRPPGIPARPSRHGAAWLLGAAALAGLGFLATLALSGVDDSAKAPAATATTANPASTNTPAATATTANPGSTKAPAATATTAPTATRSSTIPSTRTTVTIAPPVDTAPVPRESNKGKDRDRDEDDEKKGKQ